MTQDIVIKGEFRVDSSKGKLRRMRMAGQIPGIIYGKYGMHEVTLEGKTMPKKHPGAQMLQVQLGTESKTVIMRDVQVCKVTQKVLHVDFQEVKADDVIDVKVPVVISELTKEQAKVGMIRPMLRSILVRGAVRAIPAQLSVAVEQLNVGETMHVSDVAFPEGISVRTKIGASILQFAKK